MSFYRKRILLRASQVSVLCGFVVTLASSQSPSNASQAPAKPRPVFGVQGPLPVHKKYTSEQIDAGGSLFQQNCAFCHGRDAGGGESGPDLTRSKLVETDSTGEKIAEVVKNGRLDRGMPKFNLGDAEVDNLAAFIHSQQDKAMSETGNRKGVDASDLQTGNAEAGKQYFNGAGGCAKCHSPAGDLAGVATRYEGLQLEQRMLYPRGAKAKVSVTTRDGKTYEGTVAHRDEFTIALTGSDGVYRSWRTGDVKYKIDAPAEAHVELFDKYTDADIHNLMAYIQTLR